MNLRLYLPFELNTDIWKMQTNVGKFDWLARINLEINNDRRNYSPKKGRVFPRQCRILQIVSSFTLRSLLLNRLMHLFLSISVFTRELFVEYNAYISLSLLFHFVIFVVTSLYTMKLHKLNQPVPDKPVSFAESDDNDNF